MLPHLDVGLFEKTKNGAQVDASFSILAHHQDKSNTTSDGGSSSGGVSENSEVNAISNFKVIYWMR